MALLIELDVFSGRPNPQWELDAPAERELRQLLGGLSVAPGEPAGPAGLGYRGFRFDIGETAAPSRAFRGRVALEDRVLEDPGRAVERFLLSTAPAELEALRHAIADEIGS